MERIESQVIMQDEVGCQRQEAGPGKEWSWQADGSKQPLIEREIKKEEMKTKLTLVYTMYDFANNSGDDDGDSDDGKVK